MKPIKYVLIASVFTLMLGCHGQTPRESTSVSNPKGDDKATVRMKDKLRRMPENVRMKDKSQRMSEDVKHGENAFVSNPKGDDKAAARMKDKSRRMSEDVKHGKHLKPFKPNKQY